MRPFRFVIAGAALCAIALATTPEPAEAQWYPAYPGYVYPGPVYPGYVYPGYVYPAPYPYYIPRYRRYNFNRPYDRWRYRRLYGPGVGLYFRF